MADISSISPLLEPSLERTVYTGGTCITQELIS